MVSASDVDRFRAQGFLLLPGVFTGDSLAALVRDADLVLERFAAPNVAWRGPWREHILAPDERDRVVLSALHEIQLYSAEWARALTSPAIADIAAALLGVEAVELHHCTFLAKAPRHGAPFPMHQDSAYYPHADNRYVDFVVHLDDADDENGCLRFVPGSHQAGLLPHMTSEGTNPHLPPETYRLADAVPVPAAAGDVVVFHLHTVHGSSLNRTARWRRVVRFGVREPSNRQIAGRRTGELGWMIRGVRLPPPAE